MYLRVWWRRVKREAEEALARKEETMELAREVVAEMNASRKTPEQLHDQKAAESALRKQQGFAASGVKSPTPVVKGPADLEVAISSSTPPISTPLEESSGFCEGIICFISKLL